MVRYVGVVLAGGGAVLGEIATARLKTMIVTSEILATGILELDETAAIELIGAVAKIGDQGVSSRVYAMYLRISL